MCTLPRINLQPVGSLVLKLLSDDSVHQHANSVSFQCRVTATITMYGDFCSIFQTSESRLTSQSCTKQVVLTQWWGREKFCKCQFYCWGSQYILCKVLATQCSKWLTPKATIIFYTWMCTSCGSSDQVAVPKGSFERIF